MAGVDLPSSEPDVSDTIGDYVDREFVAPRAPQMMGSAYRSSIVVDSENVKNQVGGIVEGMDPIRNNIGSYWITTQPEQYPQPTLDWLRQDSYAGVLEDASIINSITQHEVIEETEAAIFDGVYRPYGARRERLRIRFKNERFTSIEQFNQYLLNYNYDSTQTYSDHCTEYMQPISERERVTVGEGAGGGTSLYASVKFDYNFYTRRYEQNIGDIPEPILPHIYTLYLEKERGLISGDTAFYGSETDVDYFDPRINQDYYNSSWTYNDFITLNRASKQQRVFINILRETSAGSNKISEQDRGEYYDVWVSSYPLAIAGSVETSSGQTDLLPGLFILTQKYRNIIVPLTTEDRMLSSYNSYKELFPIFSEIRVSQASPNRMVEEASEDKENLPAFNNLTRDIISDFQDTEDSQFSVVKSFTEAHEQLFLDREPYSIQVAGTAFRKVFNISEWALGEESVAFDEDTYVFLENFVGALDLDTPGAPSLEDNIDKIEEDESRIIDIKTTIAEKLTEMYQDHRRTYGDILAGNRAYSEDLLYKVSKYFVSDDGTRSILPMQSYYFINNKHNRDFIDLIDSQLKYGTSYEYEVHTFRLIFGSKTTIAAARYFNPLEYDATTVDEGISIYRTTGQWRNLDGSSPLGTDPTVVISPGPAIGSLDRRVSAGEYPEETIEHDSPEIFLAEVEVMVEPSIQVVQLPYVSSVTSNMNVLRGTVFDDPPIAPDVNIVSYRGVNNNLLFLLNTGIGSVEAKPISLTTEEQLYYTSIRNKNVDPNKTTILFENDDPSVEFKIYRMDTRPSSYLDFRSNLLATVQTSDELIGYRQSSGVAYKNFVEPNKKYYYMFRAVDIHGHISNPSSVYEIELIDNDGAVFPNIKIVDFVEADDFKTKNKKLNRFLKISPAFLQKTLDRSALAESTSGPPDTAPNDKDLPIGIQDVKVWGKNYKIRLTSRKTGRKLDLNIKFTKEYDPSRVGDVTYSYAPPSAPGDITDFVDTFVDFTTEYTPPPPAVITGNTPTKVTPVGALAPPPELGPLEAPPSTIVAAAGPGIPQVPKPAGSTGTSPTPSTTMAAALPGIPEIQGFLRKDPATDEAGLRLPPKPPQSGG